MAISDRIRMLTKPIIDYYLDPTGEKREKNTATTVKEMDVTTTSKSLGIAQVYTKNKALTLFANQARYFNVFSGEEISDCLGNDLRFIRQTDEDHDTFHKPSILSDLIQHKHILKGEYF